VSTSQWQPLLLSTGMLTDRRLCACSEQDDDAAQHGLSNSASPNAPMSRPTSPVSSRSPPPHASLYSTSPLQIKHLPEDQDGKKASLRASPLSSPKPLSSVACSATGASEVESGHGCDATAADAYQPSIDMSTVDRFALPMDVDWLSTEYSFSDLYPPNILSQRSPSGISFRHPQQQQQQQQQQLDPHTSLDGAYCLPSASLINTSFSPYVGSFSSSSSLNETQAAQTRGMGSADSAGCVNNPKQHNMYVVRATI